MQITRSSLFKKSWKKLPNKIQKQAIKKIQLFSLNPFDGSLSNHALHNKLKEKRAFSINYEYRVLYETKNNNVVKFLNIGTHAIYK